jgi:hypothetical protein
MLPHAPHAREVVLELRELDLELPLGGHGVLGEDVEDQLRPVDDTGGQRVLERPLLRRLQLVVDDERLGIGVGDQRQLLELACPVGVRIGAGRRWTSSRPAATPAVRRSSRSSPSSSFSSTPGASTATTNPRSGSAPGAGSG